MLASRLGAAALIVMALSIFIESRPFSTSRVTKTVAPGSEKEKEPTVKIGPFTIDPNGAEDDSIRKSVERLRDSGILDEEAVNSIHTQLARAQTDLELEAEALEIARQLAAHEIRKFDAPQPNRLSESEIQSLVVERLLSVQNQMQEDDANAATTSSSSSSSSAASSYRKPPDVEHAAAPSSSPQAPSPLPSGNRQKSDLKRIEGNFSGQTLMGTDFRNQDLSGLDFSNARLTGASFDGSDLTGANFSGAQIQGTSFADTILDDVNLTNAQAQTAHFERASLVRANLSFANFAGAVLTNADLRGAVMNSLNLNGAVMQGTRTGGAP